jgi:hypothetical protein
MMRAACMHIVVLLERAPAVQFGYCLHLFQKPSSLLAIGLELAILHNARVLASFVDGQSVADGHRFLGKIII